MIICVYMSVCIYIYIYTYTHTQTQLYIHKGDLRAAQRPLPDDAGHL